MDNEIGDYELETGEGEIEPEDESFPERPPGRPFAWMAAVVVAAILIVVSIFFFRSESETETAAEEPEAQAPAPETRAAIAEKESEPPLDLPALSASDTFVRDLARALSSRPEIARWLATDELVRRFVATIDNVAEGVSPRPHLTFLAPEGDFEVVDLGGERVVIDPRSYNRYNQIAAVVGSLDAQGTAKLLRNLEPLLDDAYTELGYPEGSFRSTFQKAFRSLLAVPVIAESAVRLEPGVTAFKYSSPELENLTDAQKHLLRAGPDNTRVFQAKIREIQAALANPANEAESAG